MKKENKKVVVVYYGDDWKKKIPFEKSPYVGQGFEFWHKEGQKLNLEFYRASIKWYNEKENVFEKSWAYRDKKWQKIKKPIKPDLIFDKIAGKKDYELFDWKMKVSKKVKFFNNPLFRTLCDNKLNQYILFKEFMAPSFLVNNFSDLKNTIAKLKSTKAVLKPFYGSGGFGIFIGSKKEALKQKIEYPILVQEFIKSEKGIPGFSQKNELADLRLVLVNHKVIYALSRIAKKGSLFTNFHQGAEAVSVPLNKIPNSVNLIVKKMIQSLSSFSSNNYSIDFLFTNNKKPILVEINTTPGLDLTVVINDSEIQKKYFYAIAEALKNV